MMRPGLRLPPAQKVEIFVSVRVARARVVRYYRCPAGDIFNRNPVPRWLCSPMTLPTLPA